MKRIGVNTRLLIKGKLDGIGWYQYEVLKRIVRSNPDIEFVFFFDRQFHQDFIFADNVKPVVIGPQARHPILFKIWFNQSITKALKKYEIDIFFSPDGYLSLKTDVPQVATIHDLNFEHHPEYLRPSHAKYYKKYFPLFAKKAKRIITVSEFSKNDIENLYKIDSDKISTVYNGVNNLYAPISEEKISETRSKFTGGSPYFIFIGSLHARKNIAGLINAFAEFKEKSKSNHKLVLAGARYDWDDEMEKVKSELKNADDLIITGRVPQSDLNLLLAGSEALTYISHFEGFGMPILEGMKAGVPVIAANNTSIPEVAGDAAILVDSTNQTQIVDAMLVMLDQEKRRNLIEKGFNQVEKFSWDKAALETWQVLKQC